MKSFISPSQARANQLQSPKIQSNQGFKGTAILVVSHGTTHSEALTSGIVNVELTISNALPHIPVFRALTSQMVIESLKKRDLVIDKPDEAIKHLIEMGFSHIVVQPLHLIPGFEFEKLRRSVVMAAHNRSIHMQLGRPLLQNHGDYLEVIDALKKHIPSEVSMQGVLWMGHGTTHSANSSYVLLERLWRETRKDIYIANIDGYPELDLVIETLKQEFHKIVVMPLMLVAGNHAINDMASDRENSFKSKLEAQGIEVICVVKGLGACPEIAALFSNRVKEMISLSIK